MKYSLRQLFVLSLISSIGLLCLQGYWIREQWKSGRDILTRQVDFAFQQSLQEELQHRKDTLGSYLKELLYDTTFIGVGTINNNKEKIWRISMYDPEKPSDRMVWSNEKFAVGEKLLPGQKEDIIEHDVADVIRQYINSGTVFYYTQRFGKIWQKKQNELRLDTTQVNKIFREKLMANNITTPFTIRYRNTTVTKESGDTQSGTLYSDEVPVTYVKLYDYDQKYRALAIVESPGIVLLHQMWLAILSSVVLLSLALFCLYRMYQTIIRQKHLDDLKNDFLSSMTHELKTPIATVSAAIDGLQYYDGLDDQHRTTRYLDTSRSELQKLDGIVSKVLALTVLEISGQQLKNERFELKAFLERLLSSFAIQPTFSWHLEMDASLKITGDKDKLTSVFQHIIENSIKYGQNNIILHIHAKQKADQLVIEIKDNGPGVDPEHLPHIFNKFYRAPSNVTTVKGFGLGLYYVRLIISAHQGIIIAKNEKGLVFMIQLPLKD